MQDSETRTSVTLDDEAYELASTYPAGRRITHGAAIGELMKSPGTSAAERFPNIKAGRNGIPILSSRVGPITTEMVKAATEDET